jgi:hypothetical protein
MRTPRALLPLAVAAGLAIAASPASAAPSSPFPPGEDDPPVVPSLIQTRIDRTENALERLTEKVDDQDSAGVVRVSKVIRRQTAAAWRGAKYYLRTAPPPVAEDAAFKASKNRSFMQDDPVAPVVADPYLSAVVVLGMVHDVTSQAIELTDGAHGDTLAGLSKTLFWSLDKRDAMVKDAQAFEPVAVPGEEGGEEAAGGFGALIPFITAGLDDELQHIDGLRTDATDLNVRGKSILRQALTQILLTHRSINAIWPPAPVDD